MSAEYDVIIRNGMLYDGSGALPVHGDLSIQGQRIAALGDCDGARGRLEIDANGLAVAPGFINMLSWACESLIEDGCSQSEIRQGVTLEVMGESFSYGPLSEPMKAELLQQQGDIRYEIAWTSLGEYLEHLVWRGVSTNVASFVGAGTLRTHTIGFEDRPATTDELERMCALARLAMEEGAMGLASALIYVPDCFNRTEELIAMASAVGQYGGLYISHLRSEGDRFLEAVDELLAVARQAGVRAEIYHLKASGQKNWHKLEMVIEKVEAARAQGLAISADMYTYIASATGLDVTMPPWVQEGGHQAWVERLKDPHIRQRVRQEMRTPSDEWENGLLEARSPENILLVSFKNPALKPLTGKTLAEVAALRGASPEDTIMDLVVEDDSRVGAVYFTMSEDNLRRQIALPWVSFCSDAASLAPEGVFLSENPHPRAYGAFARLLGKYVRDERLISLEEAIRRLTTLSAANLRLEQRGALKTGYFADLAIFDPAAIQDHATFDRPHQYASGMVHVFVNGVQVLCDGEHTGVRPGQVVRGPGWRGRQQ
ncbi:MAG: D-aminoacylase [Anaerolineales bacterium]|nr:D-aminoacylase [Anaerolineales bacterium]